MDLFDRLRVGSDLIDLPSVCWARRVSYRLCKLSQNAAVVPKKCARRKVVQLGLEAWRYRGTLVDRLHQPQQLALAILHEDRVSRSVYTATMPDRRR